MMDIVSNIDFGDFFEEFMREVTKKR